jgi:uncharacterized membrane protein
MSTQPGGNRLRMVRARDSLRGQWGLAVSGAAIYALVVFANVVPILGALVSLLVSGAMSIGIARFSLAIGRKTPTKISDIFTGFDTFGVGLGAYLLQALFVMLWCLLLIVPGIIAALSYAMTFYIIAEEPALGPLQAIAKSKQLMQGHKWELFCLGLRFVGWSLLCVLSLGVGFLWLLPYMLVTVAHFYDDIRAASNDVAAPTATA